MSVSPPSTPIIQPRRRLNIRVLLSGLVLACALPVWIAAGFLIHYAYVSSRIQTTGRMQEMARSLTRSVDRELASVEAALLGMATSSAFASGDLAGIHRQAQMLLQFYPGADVVLADRTGQQVINSYLPLGSPLPKRNLPGQVRRIFESAKPAVSDLFLGAVTKKPLLSIDVPVFRDGVVAYDLAMTLPADRLREILLHQRLPADWIASILDARHVVVARTRKDDEFVGRLASQELQRAMADAAEGTIQNINLEGTPVFAAFSRSQESGWAVAINLPIAAVRAEIRPWLWWTLGGVASLNLAGIAVAVAIGRGIAERDKMEAAIRYSRDRFEAFAKVSSDLFWETDRKFRFTWLSENVADATGQNLRSLLGRTRKSLIVDVDPETRAQYRDDLRNTRSFRNIAYLIKSDSEKPRHLQVSGVPIFDDDGGCVGYRGTGTDVTVLKQAEIQSRESMLAAEAANRAKSVFLAAASHDLRQPLQALGLYLGVLEDRLSPQDAPIMKHIERCLGSLNELLGNLLELSKLDAGVVTPTLCELPLADLMTKLVSAHAAAAEAKGIRLRAVPTRFWVRSDPVLLERLIGNLVANAVRYTRHGGVVIGCRRRGGTIWVTVTDSGIGIPKEKQDEIFEAFRQLGNEERSREKGSGLGLAIVKKTAALLNSDIRVISRLGRGSTFAVSFPLDVPVGKHAAPPSGEDRRLQTALLSADDCPQLLGRKGFE